MLTISELWQIYAKLTPSGCSSCGDIDPCGVPEFCEIEPYLSWFHTQQIGVDTLGETAILELNQLEPLRLF